LPAASLLVAVGVGALARLVRWRPAMWALPLAAVLIAVIEQRTALFTLSPVGLSRAVYGANPFPQAVAIAAWLREPSAPDDRIAVVGSEAEIYFYARRRAATTYMYTYPMMEPQPFARRMQDDMIAQIERARPRFLVLVNVDTSWSRRPDSSTRVLDWAADVAD